MPQLKERFSPDGGSEGYFGLLPASGKKVLSGSLVGQGRKYFMCRNIKVLYNFDPPASDDEIFASSLQFVRKISGFRQPSKQNEEIFNQSVQDITRIVRRMIDSFETNAPAKNRETEAEKARMKAINRFG